MKCNKTVGNAFEQEFCELLAANGFWAHNMAQNKAGQPADVIAVRNNRAILIDCKDCTNDRFDLSRIEPNQETAMTLWLSTGNKFCYFALRLSNKQIYLIPFSELIKREKDLTLSDITSGFMSFEKWVGVMLCSLA